MATVTKPIALDESFNTTEVTPRNIADVLAEGIGDLIHAVSQIAPQTVYDLDDLGDVDITSPSNGQVLKYNGTSQKWENGTGGGSGDSVSWSQIQQSGTKIAEIEINGVTTDVYAPTGGGFSALLVITAGTGLTVTASKGGDTYTATEISTGTYEVSVDSAGTWTVSDGSNTATVAVSASTTYYVTLSSVPDGKTVLPTDDVSIWLACGQRSEAYTTLSQVLADSTCLSALISDSNAVDYLVRSKSFAKSEALVPTMTSDTTPSGECITAHERSGNEAYKAFDNDTTTTWSGYSGEANQYVGYIFPSQKKIKKCVIKFIQNPSSSSYTVPQTNWKIQIGDSWTDVGTFTIPSSSVTNTTTITKILDVETNKIRIFSSDTLYVAAQYNTRIQDIQFFNVEEGLTENATAMSYIGLNNYASNTLLADSTWCSAMLQSSYRDSVFNVKTPAMTSNNTPSGLVYGDFYRPQDGESSMYKAFDNDSSTKAMYNGTSASSKANIGYHFTSRSRFYGLMYQGDSNGNYLPSSIQFKVSNDNSTYISKGDAITPTSDGNKHYVYIDTESEYEYLKLECGVMWTGNYYVCQLAEIQFYGRADI